MDKPNNMVELAKKQVEKALGIPYEEFESLDYDVQQQLIKESQEKQPKNKSDRTTVMIGSGEHAIFMGCKRGEKVMINGGIFIKAGLSLEEQQKLSDTVVETHKPIQFVKKITRNFNH